MKIIEYEDKYLEDVKDLLVELEKYILSIDKDNLDQLHPEYREKMAILDLEKVKNNNGKCYIAVENDKENLFNWIVHLLSVYACCSVDLRNYRSAPCSFGRNAKGQDGNDWW